MLPGPRYDLWENSSISVVRRHDFFKAAYEKFADTQGCRARGIMPYPTLAFTRSSRHPVGAGAGDYHHYCR